jgi:hypothetical protein
LDEKRYITTAYHDLMADGSTTNQKPKHKRIYLLIICTGSSYYVINSDTVPLEIGASRAPLKGHHRLARAPLLQYAISPSIVVETPKGLI